MSAPPPALSSETPDGFAQDGAAPPPPPPPEDGALGSPVNTHAPATPGQTAPHDGVSQQRVHEVLHSDVGVTTLLNRLKASIASAKEFASFLKRRGALEEELAGGLKKLSRLTLDGVRRPDARHESFQTQFELVLHANERIADNGTHFGLALHAMHENLLTLASKSDASRKNWKQQGLAAEAKVAEAEKLAEKARTKYEQFAEDLDRVKTGDTGAGRKFGLKGPKSAAQHEEDLQRKTQAADQDYASKVQAAQNARKELVATGRPQAVAALLDLIKETDAALTMEMQKYASFNEQLIVNNGQIVIPQPLGGTTNSSNSLNQLIHQINNDRDFDDYVISQASKGTLDRPEVQYVKHPTQIPAQSNSSSAPAPRNDQSSSLQTQSQPPPSFALQSEPSLHSPAPVVPQKEPVQQPNFSSYTQQQQPYSPYGQSQPPSSSTFAPPTQMPYSPPDHSRGSAGLGTAQQSSGVLYNNSRPPVNPVFGLSLDDLFRRDSSPVPMVVYQCIQAVDLFGLEVEGIYRIPGTTSHIQQLKAVFDNDASQVDFRNPEAFQHDVNSVAGLLKQFFRELPDPLLTREYYGKFIDAARIDDDTMRRDSMHALINALPDPNYATLRALVLHLHRVQQASDVNRMSTANLGICWAPSILGPHKGNNVADAGLQARVIITILDHVLQIFDED